MSTYSIGIGAVAFAKRVEIVVVVKGSCIGRIGLVTKRIIIVVVVLKIKIATQEQCSCKVVIEENKFKAVSNTVWICLKAMI